MSVGACMSYNWHDWAEATHVRIANNEFNRLWHPELIGNIYPKGKAPSYLALEPIKVNEPKVTITESGELLSYFTNWAHGLTIDQLKARQQDIPFEVRRYGQQELEAVEAELEVRLQSS